MLISDSLPLLWLCYIVLALIVLVTGYFAFSFLPRLPRWVLVGLVAGALLMPAHFTIPGPKEQLGYSGWAPALIVTVVGVLQHHGGQILGAGLWMLVGMIVLGALFGWFALRRRHDGDDSGSGHGEEAPSRRGHQRTRPVAGETRPSSKRREPSLGQ
ncbi:hypothetical protein [Kushneria phosphatilytica]|uniref:Uncharacterized protein n=1 Tax=Kushneria phosphatilytica TaxID=657387 RepID=A0A1S1NUN2_9GAMM|nr:hypothetical protein [Kushneria phosphatilytica]OHV10254.1 hypothetical protein BH688_09645 [Kushneria phosphatilytica]QEL11553.1 hypothetical protein FY550_10705 [Kushneria phosphatilytica]